MPATAEVRTARRKAQGAAVRDRRQFLGLSQEALAQRAGVERKSVSRVKTGTYSPSVDRLWDICDALEVSLPVLLSPTGPDGQRDGSVTNSN
ncbi:helix-turn-helix transcriptional regulator [Geodermatophilus sp. SYSU D00525]